MKPHEYELYVARLVQELDSFKTGKLYTNHQFPGVRQPGSYEVDVAIEIVFEALVRFLLIVECKLWARPVDRPVVQKLVQTRDAIAAHKAAIASPVGFSQEAIEVAKANGVALWLVAENKRIKGIVSGPPNPLRGLYDKYRQELYDLLGFQVSRERPESALVEFEAVKASLPPSAQAANGDQVYVEELGPGDRDRRTARYHLYQEVASTALKLVDRDDSPLGIEIKGWRKRAEARLSGGLSSSLMTSFLLDLDDQEISTLAREIARQALEAVLAGDLDRFMLAFQGEPFAELPWYELEKIFRYI